MPPLPLVRGGPAVDLPRRVWIDTDAACGHGRTTDPDDCFALLLLLRSPSVSVVGISTVHGNAPLAITDSITRALVGRAGRRVPVYRGSAVPLDERDGGAPAPAHAALRQALAGGPLTLVALGPLTNVALALERVPALRAKVARLVAVMGRRPGHLFHPAEGHGGGGMLFGHGPVFTDFNFAQDRKAATRLLGFRVPTTLVPYEAAREVTLAAPHLDRIARADAASAWVVSRAGGWLEYWRDQVGLDGFYPFDLVGAAYPLAPRLFDCADTDAWVGRDERLWGWLGKPALVVGDMGAAPAARGRITYCPALDPSTTGWLVEALTSADTTSGGRAGP